MTLPVYPLTVTTAGLAALVDAQNGETDAIRVTEVGFTNQQFTVAPTLTALPGEIKRIDTISGTAVSENIIHMTAQDASADAYTLRAFGLYLDDGTLFAVYAQPAPIATKTPIVQLQLAFDIAFQNAIAGDVEFGDASFLIPPATESVKGVAEIATHEEVAVGEDDERIVTPLKLAAALAALAALFVSATEEVEGLIELATQGEVNAGADDARAVTPLKLATRLQPVLAAIATESQTRETAIGQVFEGLAQAFAAIADLGTRTVTGSGLVTGGGAIAANPVLAVAAASVAQLLAGTAADVALTPAAFGPIVKSFSQNGYLVLALGDPANAFCFQWGRNSVEGNTASSIGFNIAFSDCWSVVVDGTSNGDVNAQDNDPAVRPASITGTGFVVFSARDVTEPITWLAVGKVSLA